MDMCRIKPQPVFATFIFVILLNVAVYGDSSGCSCVDVKNTCGCCVHLKISSIGVDDTGCVNITYLPKEYGISVTLTIDNYVIINETVSAKHPPPLCAAVPYFKAAASICLDFYDLDLSNHTFSGCVDLEARLYWVVTEKIHLGCWNLGSKMLISENSIESMNTAASWKKNLQAINMQREKNKLEYERMKNENKLKFERMKKEKLYRPRLIKKN